MYGLLCVSLAICLDMLYVFYLEEMQISRIVCLDLGETICALPKIFSSDRLSSHSFHLYRKGLSLLSFPVYSTFFVLLLSCQPQAHKTSSYKSFSNYSQMTFQSEHPLMKEFKDRGKCPIIWGNLGIKMNLPSGLKVNLDQPANEFSYLYQQPCNSSRLWPVCSGCHVTPACGPMSRSLSSDWASVLFPLYLRCWPKNCLCLIETGGTSISTVAL